MRWLLIAGIALSISPMALANTISIFSTGVDGSGDVLAGGSSDPHWSVTLSDNTNNGPAKVISASNMGIGWHGDDAVGGAGSAWIGVTDSTSQPTNYDYSFNQTFSLAGLDPTTAVITGKWFIANTGDLVINGHNLENDGGTTNGDGFTINSLNGYLIAGLNTLSIVATSGAANDAGVRLSITSATADVATVPAPAAGTATLALLGVLAWKRRRGSCPRR